MKLHSMVRGMIGTVNNDIIVSLYRSIPYIKNGTHQIPQYEPPIEITVQVQSLSSSDLQYVNFTTMQGEHKAVYSECQLYGADRVRGTGGDILEFYGRRWLVVQRLEAYENSGWCKVMVTSQLDHPQDDEAEIEDNI
ncbi:unnamed protein product [Commensalibacter communis]|uniref:Uncharacterized protein n=1 Tax=Commensalibacter communis TaxID=2972786 RepID=A0A9W4TQ97_9PROT|nr:hypothetical protein [Commensalibacter communis]CAI3941784.1 unnamed protein product [Commensalibacter communis]CAI3944847.1 unnamed protein product [Commensalibacter communis]CAI3959055.1 unnamed protein product [Commensalibacter communis]CAI3961000.1 unnamed protein product [Commensalibacter communis]